jgi:gamma-glutamyltranspeptidase/glutathione hydrolase
MNQRTLNRIGLLGLALLMFLSLGFVPADQALVPFEDIAGPGSTGAAVAANGMVSTANRYATLAGLETLRAGGNAVDAMAVVQFVLNVAEPYASGIGGGNFIMIYDAASGEVIAIDGREEAPEAYSPDIFLDDQGEPVPFNDRSTGGNPVGVPGTLAATARALEEYGTISLEEALEPAIELARRGFVVDTPFALAIAADTERIALFEATTALYLDEDGQPLAAGDTFSNPDLADTLELIAQQGIEVFYEGEIAEDIVAAVQNAEFNPGVMELTDLAGYRAVRREPVSTTYRGYEVYGMNMPTSGGTTLMMMLNTLEGIDLPSMEWGSLSHIHRIADAQNLAFADRNAYMGDADFVDVPVALSLIHI